MASKSKAAFIHLEEISINPNFIVDVNWGKDDVAEEKTPDGATELVNPNAGAGVESPKVAVIRYAVRLNDAPLSLVIDRASEDFETLKQALGKD